MHIRMISRIAAVLFLLSRFTASAGAAEPEITDTPALVTASGKALTGEHVGMFWEYTQRLRDYPVFTAGTAGGAPRWRDASPDDPGFRELVEQYGLDTIAGAGNELERALRVMDWVHRTLTSFGVATRPPVLTTPDIIAYVAEGNTIYCQPKAIVLTECLTALGFHARYLSLNPMSFDYDSHSVVAVYMQSLGKWIMLDPTFNTYFHDRSGMPLSFADVRDTYRQGHIPAFRTITLDMQAPLRLRGVEYFSYDQWYAVYMGKNTFWAISPLAVTYGYHATKSPQWIALAPENYEPDDTIVSRYRTSEGQLRIIRSIEQFFPAP